MFSKDIGVDLGTANVLIYFGGKGIVLNEPSVVAIDKRENRVLEVGEAAHLMIGRTPAHIDVIRPMKEGVIADFDMTETMLRHFLDKIDVKSFLTKPRILICYPINTTMVEQKAMREAAVASGAKSVYLEEEPKVAAIGAGINIEQPSGSMVMDIGGGTTDVAVLSMGGIVTSGSIRRAGDQFDLEILQYIKHKYKLIIGERTAEEVKMKAATVFKDSRNEEMDIRGRNMMSGLPETITITSNEMEEALRDSASMIVQTARSVLEQTPPELSADIIDHGLILTGGGALLHGMDKLLADELKVPIFIAEDPMHCVARGTGIMLENLAKSKKKDIG